MKTQKPHVFTERLNVPMKPAQKLYVERVAREKGVAMTMFIRHLIDEYRRTEEPTQCVLSGR